MKNWFKNNWFKLVVIIFSLSALGHWPYGYYQILRWIICSSSAYLSYSHYKSNKTTWAWVFGIIAILFNPILPIYLTREIWKPINIIVAVIFFISLFIKFKKRKNEYTIYKKLINGSFS